jgi:hypothetical protein
LGRVSAEVVVGTKLEQEVAAVVGGDVDRHGDDGTWDRCYDFLNIFAEKFSEKIGVFDLRKG